MRKVTFTGLRARKLRLALTALAIVLGVTFVTGTLVLGDTLNSTFNTLIGTAYQHVSYQIRGKAAFTNNSTALDGGDYRKPVPQSIAARVTQLPGVSFVYGSVQGHAQFVAPDGTPIKNGGSPTQGYSFDPNPQLSPLRLIRGHQPTGPHDVVMDESTATKYHFTVGGPCACCSSRSAADVHDQRDRHVRLRRQPARRDARRLRRPDRPAALRLDRPLRHDQRPGQARSDNVALERSISKVLPAGVEVVSGQAVTSELTTAVDHELGFISTALLVFAFIALFVGGFTIFNTFSITVGQRTRELALLRIVGASRKQLFRSVLAEAALTGLLASLIGLGLGVLAALGLKALLSGFGITLPSSELVFEARTALVAIAVGVGVTMIAAVAPARRAVRIAPVAALVPDAGEEAESSRRARCSPAAPSPRLASSSSSRV